jgi:coenzyme F420-reducing hydrogenase delta subunit
MVRTSTVVDKFKEVGLDEVRIQTRMIDESARKRFHEIVKELKNKRQKVTE